eukprot:TRINITY_DN2287_c0_g3_i1.p1 TRINITY_DN2287_c0_g3~~TRINITY_DN2287_c0_g3_i1.p1  ORF type:complete len:253 (-),score=45.48 TRINITY_DN2287_c0_g3_i1:126-884(-)
MDNINNQLIQEQGGNLTINELPRDLREKFWSYCDDKEFYRLRGICKQWKKEIENPKSVKLLESINNSQKESLRFLDGKYFYKNYSFTSMAITDGGYRVGLQCCYGKVLRITQFSFALLCMLCGSYIHSTRGAGKGEDISIIKLSMIISFSSIFFPFGLVGSILCLFIEFLRLMVWLITCRCFFNECEIRTYSTLKRPNRNNLLHPPFPSEEKLTEEIQVPFGNNKYLPYIEEKLNCGSAVAICFCGGKICDF